MANGAARRRLSAGQVLLNGILPRGGYRLLPAQVFGPHREHLLDVYRPRRPGGAVVIFFYGGRWSQGNRTGYRFIGQALAARGITTIIPDYRLYPEVRFPLFVQDAAAAVAWTRRRAAEFGGDPGRICLMGHSAGAHIAALLALDRTYLAGQGLRGPVLAGVIGLAGPYDFLPLQDADLRDIFGPESAHPRTQPIAFARADAAPFLLLTGAQDRTVSPGNSRRLWQRLNEQGGRAHLVSYRRLNHITLLAALAAPLRLLGPVLPEVLAFVRQSTGAGGLPEDFGRAPVERQAGHEAA